MKKSIIVLSIALMTTPVIAQQKLFRDGVGIASICIVMPVGRVLLVGRDGFLGAVKFLYNEKKPDGMYSRYEYFEFERPGFKKIGEGEVVLKTPSSGKGMFFHGSPDDLAGPPLKLRNFSLFATAGGTDHSTVYFRNARSKPDKKVRMAPTPWKEMKEVKLSDPRIRWFAYDDKESWEVIPIDKIWD